MVEESTSRIYAAVLLVLSLLYSNEEFAPTVSAFQQPLRWGVGNNNNPLSQKLVPPCFVHVAAHPPKSIQRTLKNSEQELSGQQIEHESLENLCTLLQANPADLLYLAIEDGERGVYVNEAIEEGDAILRIPLSSCIRDDCPPGWYQDAIQQRAHDDGDLDNVEDNPHHYNPSQWATRLAASLLSFQMNLSESEISSPVKQGQHTWLSMMPDEKILRASLPIHWSEDIVSSAKCTALELSIDTSFFARAEAVADLTAALGKELSSSLTADELERKCQNVLDLVQTRSCRVEALDGAKLCPQLRVLAPIFDFINHGSARHDGVGSANAYFGLEDEQYRNDSMLVVRAKRSIAKDEEVLFDYGDSTRPSWRCLASYGFVPEYRITSPDDEWEGEEDESVAEVFMDGSRYEVGSHIVPFEMVEAATFSLEEEQNTNDIDYDKKRQEVTCLSPEVALRIGKRVSDAAYQLLVEDVNDEEIENDLETIISYRSAASLRWSQHHVLLACATGLRDYAMNSNSSEKQN